MDRQSSRFNSVLVLCALVLAVILVNGCRTSASPSPTALPPTALSPTFTPVPIAAWIAEGISDDTLISYSWELVSSRSASDKVTITADGTINWESRDSWDAVPSQGGTGRMSQDELKRILTRLDEINFFSLESDGKCVFYPARPPAPSQHIWGTTCMDYSRMDVSVTIHGVSARLYTEQRGGPPQKCLYDAGAAGALDKFRDLILEVGRQVTQLMPTPGR